MSTRHDANNREQLDQTPVEIPLGFKRPETLAEQIRRMIRVEASQAAGEAGFETFEEADDFDVGDDLDPSSPWELTYDQEMEPRADLGPSRASSGAEAGAQAVPEGTDREDAQSPSQDGISSSAPAPAPPRGGPAQSGGPAAAG